MNLDGARNQQKWAELCDIIQKNQLDICLVTETHLRNEELPANIEEELRWVGLNRTNGERKGGGIGALFKKDINMTHHKKCTRTTNLPRYSISKNW